MSNLRFSVYDHKLVYDEDHLLNRQLIVLKDEYGNIVGWTNFHKYARGGKKSLAKSLYAGPNKRCTMACLFLNYVFFDKYHIKKLTDVKANMVKDFLNDYGLCNLPGDNERTHRGKETVNLCISQIIDFLDLMIQDKPQCKMRLMIYIEKKKYLVKPRKNTSKGKSLFLR